LAIEKLNIMLINQLALIWVEMKETISWLMMMHLQALQMTMLQTMTMMMTLLLMMQPRQLRKNQAKCACRSIQLPKQMPANTTTLPISDETSK
jgi:hypothetical protein